MIPISHSNTFSSFKPIVNPTGGLSLISLNCFIKIHWADILFIGVQGGLKEANGNGVTERPFPVGKSVGDRQLKTS